MPYVRDSFWRGHDWDDLEHMQAAALGWCTTIAGRRHHRGLDGAHQVAVFAAVEADALMALPVEVFERAAWSTPKVHPDCHVKVGKALYSVPWRLIGRHVDARETDRTVEVFADGELVKTWARVERGRQTDYGDYPPEKVAFFMRNPAWCIEHAGERRRCRVDRHAVGDQHVAPVRSAQGVLGLADKRTAARLDAACRRAMI